MPTLRSNTNQHLVYEHAELAVLVAVEKAEQVKIKKFWKQYKGKQDLPSDSVVGFPFVHDEEQESLKIDFDSPGNYEIKHLKKFD